MQSNIKLSRGLNILNFVVKTLPVYNFKEKIKCIISADRLFAVITFSSNGRPMFLVWENEGHVKELLSLQKSPIRIISVQGYRQHCKLLFRKLMLVLLVSHVF